MSNLAFRTELQPLRRGMEILDKAKGEVPSGDAFLTLNRIQEKAELWDLTDRMKLLEAQGYLMMMACMIDNPHPQPEIDFIEVVGYLPQFMVTELIAETMGPREIMKVIEHHGPSIRSCIEYFIVQLPFEMQSDAIAKAGQYINPNSKYFPCLFHSVSEPARNILKAAFPESPIANDVLNHLKEIPIEGLNSEIKNMERSIKAEDSDRVIELALLRFADASKVAEANNWTQPEIPMTDRVMEFIKTNEYVLGGASDARLETMLCYAASITHPYLTGGIRKRLSSRFTPIEGEPLLCDAPGKLKEIAKKWTHEKGAALFEAVSKLTPHNVNPNELLLLFRMQIIQNPSNEFVEIEYPGTLTRHPDVPYDFGYKFHDEFGISVAGLAPTPIENDFGVQGINKDNSSINISGKQSPAAVFAALYNHAWPFGRGLEQYSQIQMDEDLARHVLNKYEGKSIGYIRGRLLKLGEFTNSSTKVHLGHYDWDNGRGIAERAIRTVANKAR